MVSSIIRNPGLSAKGAQKIEWASRHMPVLGDILSTLEESQPLAGITLALSIHLEAKTAYLAQVLHRLGAVVYATGSNPLSTQDDVCAALADSGVIVYATHDCTIEEYHEYLCHALRTCPDIIIDDGGDMVEILTNEHPEWAVNLRGGCEETTTGVLRLITRAKAGTLPFPMFNINDADCKHLFDNRYGTGQSVWDGIIRTTNLSIAGTTVVVAGYGWCGKGVSMRAKGLGANVIVTEVDPIKAIEATMDGFRVLQMSEAAPLGDLFITVTGCDAVITTAHMQDMKEGATLCNAGHFDVEVDVAGLHKISTSSYTIRNNIEAFVLPNGKTIYLLAQGRLVNLAAGDGHPIEIMDMSFSLQAKCTLHLASLTEKLAPAVYSVPAHIDQAVALTKLHSLNIHIDTLTKEQATYLFGDV